MLLKDLDTVTTIDSKITELHSELQKLYQERARLFSEPTPQDEKQNAKAKTDTLRRTGDAISAEYDRLRNLWLRYDVTIPSLDELNSGFEKGLTVISSLQEDNKALDHRLSFVLVPPAKILNSKTLPTLREKQQLIQSDHFETPVSFENKSRKWRLLVVYTGQEGLNLGSAEQLIATKSYLMNNQDTRKLGLTEYIALSLQHPLPLDIQHTTLLVKDHKASNSEVLSVGLIGGGYRFMTDDIKGIGNERFRPAVEVL